MSESTDEHYLRAVTDLGDTRKIIASRDIYSKNGMLLVAAGVSITSALYERLVHHVLLEPVDRSLTAEDMVDTEMLWRDTQSVIAKNAKLKKLLAILNKGSSLRQTIVAIKLPGPLAFKLTVAREKFLPIYQHSLAILIVSVYLARNDGMVPNEEGYVAEAALFHDMGLLHIDPALLAPEHKMTSEERRHLYVHPLTAYLMLREFPELHSSIADAVLAHHERMDGRGYPRGLHGDKISRYGQILAIAEVAALAFEPGASPRQWQKLEVMLKLNFRQYGNGLIGFLSVLREADEAKTMPSPEEQDELVTQVGLIAKLFEDFDRHAASAGSDEIYAFAQTRLTALKLELLDAGFDPLHPGELIQRFSADAECMLEYEPLLQETLWQFKTLALDIWRHWEEKVGGDNSQSEKPEYAWLNMMERL